MNQAVGGEKTRARMREAEQESRKKMLREMVEKKEGANGAIKSKDRGIFFISEFVTRAKMREEWGGFFCLCNECKSV